MFFDNFELSQGFSEYILYLISCQLAGAQVYALYAEGQQ